MLTASMQFFTKNDGEQRRIGRLLVDWFVKNQRILPWRTNPSIYNRLVSEFMLQQTQVATVIPYFKRWIEQFPSIKVLAEASEEAVLKAWEGLGYYSRVKNLHKIAKKITKNLSNLNISAPDTYPQTPEEWKNFPGIGDYTAHALASIAQNQHVAAIDGNAIRVLCRLHGIQQTFKSKNYALKFVKNIASLHVPPGKSANYNEAIMELGALICKPKNPACDRCPVEKYCLCFQKKLDCTRIPQFSRATYVKKTIRRAFVCNNFFILLRQANTKRLHNIFELPLLDDIPETTPAIEIDKISRSIARERITEMIFELQILPENLQILTKNSRELILLPIDELKNITLSGPHRKWLDKNCCPIVPSNTLLQENKN
jgi:A/G-specific adenine glycosylase